MPRSLVVLCLLGVCCFLVASVRADYLEQKKVILLDHATHGNITNFLFRGNEPKVKDASGKDIFAYDQLKKYLSLAAQNQNFSLPSDFNLIDMKLYYFHNPLENGDIQLEKEFFDAHPSLGSFVGLEIWGDAYSPSIIPSSYRKKWAKTLGEWQHDNLPALIPAIHQQLHTKFDKPTVFYFHCECGCDRTGEVAGSYMLAFKNWTLSQVNDWNYQVAGRIILPNHSWAIAWFCYYLQQAVPGFAHLSC
ncbi:hypothetical protein QOT17_010686 [Balamuthia mandrillaris]